MNEILTHASAISMGLKEQPTKVATPSADSWTYFGVIVDDDIISHDLTYLPLHLILGFK